MPDFFSNKYQLTIRHLTFHRREAHRKEVRHGQGRGHGKDAKAEANLSLSPLSSQRGAEERRAARSRGRLRQGRGGRGKPFVVSSSIAERSRGKEGGTDKGGGSRQGRGGGGKWGALDAVNGIAEGGDDGSSSGNNCVI